MPIPIIGLGLLIVFGLYAYSKSDKIDNLLFGRSEADKAERLAKTQRDAAAAEKRNAKGAIGNTVDFFGGEGFVARTARGLAVLFGANTALNTRNITRNVTRSA